MKKKLSPAFVALVILVALALGALYFMVRYRADQIAWAREKAAAKAQAEWAFETGLRGSRGAPSRRQGRRPASTPQPETATHQIEEESD